MASIIRIVVTGTAAGAVRAFRAVERQARETSRRISRDFRQELRNIPGSFRRSINEIRDVGREAGRGFGRFFRQALNGEIGGALSAAFSNPIVLAVVASVATALASVLGAAIAGALVLALGGGIAALGVVMVAKAKETKEAWSKTLRELKPIFQDAASPMIPVVEEARKKFEETAKEFAPHFKDAMTAAAPHMQTFIGSLKEGFKKLGQGAWDDITSAFNVFLVAFGPQWEDFMEELGKSLGALARTVRDHSSEIAMALRIVLGTINFLIDAINFLANVWVMALRNTSEAMGTFINGVGMMADAVLGFVDTALGAIESIAGVLGMDGPVKQARENFNRLREETRRNFDDMSRKFSEWGKNLDLSSRKRRLEVDITSWSAQIVRAQRELKSLPPERKAKALLEIKELQRKVAQAKAELASIKSRSVSVGVSTYIQASAWDTDANGVPDAIQARATGGNVGAAATGGVRSNLTMVGERGPELVNMPAGSHVRSAGDTRRTLAGMGAQGGGEPFTIVIESSGSRMDDLLVELLRGAVKAKGGNVQLAVMGRS